MYNLKTIITWSGSIFWKVNVNIVNATPRSSTEVSVDTDCSTSSTEMCGLAEGHVGKNGEFGQDEEDQYYSMDER